MSGPTLALGVTAPTVGEVERLASALERVDTALARMSGAGGGVNLNSLAALEAEMRKVSQGLTTSMAGLRTDIAEMKNVLSSALKEGFASIAKAAAVGGQQVTQEVEEQAAKTKAAAEMYKQAAKQVAVAMNNATGEFTKYNPGTGLRGSDIASQQLSELTKAKAQLMVGSEKIAREAQAAADKLAQEAINQEAQLTQRMIAADIGETAKLMQAREKAATELLSAEATLTQRMIAADIGEKAKLIAARDKAAAELAAAEGAITLRIISADMGETAKLVKAREQAAAELSAAEAAITQRMIAADIGERAKLIAAREKAAAALSVAEGELTLKIISVEMGEAAKLARERERQTDAQIAQEAALTQRLIASDIAEYEKRRNAEARYAGLSARGQLTAQIRARGFLDRGYSPEEIVGTFGASAVAGAVGASSIGALRGEYEALGKSTKVLGDTHEAARPKLKAFTDQMGEAHSAARGLASGFGAMWLTWGQLLPLLAGAAISHAFVETIKLGAEVGNTMEQIRLLAGETTDSVASLSREMLDMARNGQFGPSEIAKAMKTLSLAGLDAKETFTAVRDVLDFAVAGETNIDKAADVMTTVATAFNISADRYAYVGDVIAKAAAESKSSVESMGEAFKTASVINQQYGVSLEDTAVGLALVQNAGIRNTAAGTALRNMYADLAGRTPKVEKALKELGVNAIDPTTGKMRDMTSVFQDLTGALAKYDPTSQSKFLQDIFSERGGKEAIAIINAMRKEAMQLGGDVASAFDQLRMKVMDSAGFTARAAAEMSLTPLNQLKSMSASLQATLVETFDNLSPMILDFAAQVRSAVNSEEFKNGLSDLLRLMGQVTMFVVDHGKAILNVIATYAALKGVLAILQSVAVAWEAIIAVTKAAELATLAFNAVSGKGVLGVIASLVQTAAAAWVLYKLNVAGATSAHEDFGNNSTKALLDKLTEERDRLVKINEARERGITLMELEARAKAEQLRGNEPTELVDARKELAKFSPTETRPLVVAEKTKLQQRIAAMEQEHARNLVLIENRADEIAALRRKDQEEQRNQAALDAASIASGSLKKSNTDPKARAPYDRSLTLASQEMNARLSIEKTYYQNDERLLRESYQAKEMSAGAYFAALDQMQQNQLQSEGAILDKATKEFDKAYVEQIKNIKEKKMEPKEEKQALDNLADQYTAFGENVARIWLELRNNQQRMLGDISMGVSRETANLTKANDTYWAHAEQVMRKNLAASEARRKYANAPEEVRAAAEAVAKVDEGHSQELDKLNTQLKVAQQSLDDLRKSYDSEDVNATNSGMLQRAQDQVDVLTAAIQKAQNELNKLRGLAQQDAINDVVNKRAEASRVKIGQMANEINGKLADAILDGGKDGFKGLRDWAQDYFLRKPLKMVLQAVVSPVGNAIASTVGNILGVGGPGGNRSSGNVLGDVSGGLNLASLISKIPGGVSDAGGIAGTLGMFGAGAKAGLSGMLGEAGFMGTVDAGFTALGAGNIAGGLGTLLGPGALVLGGAMLLSNLMSQHGGPKQDAVYGMINSGIGLGQRTTENDSALGTTVKAAQDSYDALVRSLGGTSNVKFGAGYSRDPKGSSPSFVDVTASQDGKTLWTMLDRGVGKDATDVTTAITRYLNQAFLEGLKSSNVKGELMDWLRTVDIGSDLDAIYARVQKALGERAALQARLDDMVDDAATKLAKTRANELATIDSTNVALAKQVHAQEDLTQAKADLLTAYNNENSALRNYSKSLRDFVTKVMSGSSDPVANLSLAQSNFQSVLSAAHSGDADARSKLTDAAQAVITAAEAGLGSKSAYDQVVTQVVSALTLEAASADSQATVQDQQLAELKVIASATVTFADAYLKALTARDAVTAATATATESASTYTPAPAKVQSFAERWLELSGGSEYFPGQNQIVSSYWQSLYPGQSADAVWSIYQGTAQTTPEIFTGGFAVGTNRVPRDMWTKVHKDERITPAWDNPYANPYTSDSSSGVLVEEVRELRAVVKELLTATEADAVNGLYTRKAAEAALTDGVRVRPSLYDNEPISTTAV